MAKTSKYWDARRIERLTESERLSEAYIERVKKIYNKAFKNIDKELSSVYRNYSRETGLNIDKLKELLTKKETDKTWKTLKRQGLDKYILNNYKSRISRLEQIQAQIYAKAKQIYPKEELENRMCYKGVINDSYYKALYDTQMGTGYDFSFGKIDTKLIDTLLNERWSGKNYSQRIWGNTDILADSVSEIVGGALLSGQSIEKTSRQIRDRFDVSKYYAERLVRTETNHFNNEADALAYEEMGIDKYVFVAVLDSRTSEMCQNMDNKAIDYKDREVGVNFPPLHPNCRSTTRGYLGKDGEKLLQRRARNPITGKLELIENMSYKDWVKKNKISSKPVTTTTKTKPVEAMPKQVEAKPLTKDQIDAIEYYVSGEGMYLNTYFREQDGYTINDFNDRDKELIKDLDGALDRTIKPQTLYRSVDAEAIFGKMDEFKYQDLKDELLYKAYSGAKGQFSQNKATELNNLIDSIKGKTFIDKGYVSTTRSEEIAQNWSGFTGSNKEIILKINTNEGVKGLDVSNLNEKLKQIEKNDPQKETLLARNQSFTVDNVYAKDGHIYVDVSVGAGVKQEVSIDVEKTLQDIETSKHGLDHEIATVLDQKGNILQVVDGQAHSVKVDEKLLKDNIITHNHPSKTTFSSQDIETFINNDSKELRASNEDKIYSIKRVDDNTTKRGEFLNAFKENDKDMYKKACLELGRKIESGEMDESKFNFTAILNTQSELRDKWFKENANKYGYEYKVINYGDTLKNDVKNDIITPSNLLEKLNINLEDYKAFGKYDPFDNDIQEKTAKLLNMDKKPTILNKADFDKTEGVDVLRVVHEYHGKTAQEVYDNTLHGDIQYSEHHNSSFGRGIYFGDKNVADNVISDYSKGESKIITAKINKEAKIVEFANQSEYIRALSKELKTVPKELQQLYQNEKSLLFMLNGVDGIKIKSNGYYCIYNRGVLIVNE